MADSSDNTPQTPVAASLDDLTGADGATSSSPATTGEGAGEAAPSTPAPTIQPQQPQVPQARVDALTADKWNAIRRAEAAEAEAALLRESLARQNAAGSAPIEPPVPGAPPVMPSATPPTYTQADVQREAMALASQQEYIRRCTAIASEGRTAHQDFDTSISNLNRFGPLPQHIVEAAEETGQAAEVLYALGKDMGEMDRIFSSGSAVRQAAAVVRFGEKLAASKRAAAGEATRPSAAPPPIDPATGGRGPSKTPSLENDSLPMSEWIKLREKQVAANGSRR